jgi:nicotinamidase-related amidase
MKQADERFLKFIDGWMSQLPELASSEVFMNPGETAILSVDMINGFSRQGSLASRRIEAVIPAIVDLMRKGRDLGLRDIILLQDCHTSDAKEFGAYAPHAICGSSEAETVEEIKTLPFFKDITVFTKNSVDSLQNTGLGAWMAEHARINTYIIVGNCTDICVYQLANHLRARANAYDLDWRVIVPENCVQTYDLPIEAADAVGATPHSGNLLHKVFLYHMALNGVEVVKAIK